MKFVLMKIVITTAVGLRILQSMYVPGMEQYKQSQVIVVERTDTIRIIQPQVLCTLLISQEEKGNSNVAVAVYSQ